jgi:anti-sigma regulatory factor (Ser/Thr protein kinase)
MDGRAGPEQRTAAGGHVRHAVAGRPAPVPGSSQRVSALAAGLAALAPFAAWWPWQSCLELGALPGAVPCARLHARQVLWEWELTALSDTTELLVSELVTNAIQMSRTTALDTPIRLWLVCDTAQVLILVWDACPAPPIPTDASGDAESGRGLLLVDALSARWGWHSPPGMDGKVVWALIRPE